MDQSVDFPLSSAAFGIPDVKKAEEVTQKTDATVEAKTELVEEVTPKSPESPKEEVKEEVSEEDRELRRKAQEAHNVVIEMIGDKFQSLETGGMTKAQLKTWFEEHPTIAEKANRSKKYKDDFRSLMEGKEVVKATVEETEEEEEKKSSNYLTKDELKTVLSEHAKEMEERMIEKRLQSDRRNMAEEFASKYNVKDEEFDKLLKNAEAILSANEDMEFSSALTGAYGVLHPDKPKPSTVVRPTSGNDAKDTQTEVQKIMETHGLTKEIAQDLVKQGKTAETVNLKDGIPLMSFSSIK